MTSLLRGVRKCRIGSNDLASPRPAVESLEERVLLSGLPSGETAYIRFNGTGTGLGSWTEVSTLDTTNSDLEISAPLYDNSAILLPAIQNNTRISNVNLRFVKTVKGKPQVVQAEHLSSVKVKSLEWLGSGSQQVVEKYTIAFASEEGATIQVSVPNPTTKPPVTGPFDIAFTPGSSSAKPDVFRIHDFDLKITSANGKTAGIFAVSNTLDQTSADLGAVLHNSGAPAGIALYAQQPPTTNLIGMKLNDGGERLAFAIKGVSAPRVTWAPTNGKLNESITMSMQPTELAYTLENARVATPFKIPPAVTNLGSFLQINQVVGGKQGNWNPLTSLTLTAGKSAAILQVTETFTGMIAGFTKLLMVGRPFASANVAVADTAKHLVKGEFFFSNVRITSLSTSKTGSKTTVSFSFTGSITVELYPADTTSNPPPSGIAGWNRVHNDEET